MPVGINPGELWPTDPLRILGSIAGRTFRILVACDSRLLRTTSIHLQSHGDGLAGRCR